MGKIIRRTATVTITITETWTIVWSSENDPLPSTRTVVQSHPYTQEEADEILPSALTAAEPGTPSADDSTATPGTPAAALAPQPVGALARSTASDRKRAGGRRAKRNQQSRRTT